MYTTQQNNSNIYADAMCFQSLISVVKNSARTHDRSTDSIDLRRGQDQEMNTQETDSSSSEVKHQSVNAKIKQATEPILRQSEKLCAFWPIENELDTAENSEATGLRC